MARECYRTSGVFATMSERKHIVYLRTSTEDQKPENQRAACRQLLIGRGIREELIEEVKEHGSAYLEEVKRDKYEEIKERAHRGEIASITVWALDRWLRKEEMVEEIAWLAQRGVKMHSVQEQWLESINVEGAFGKAIREFLLGIVAARAEEESRRLSERVKAGMKRAQEEGKHVGRPPAYFNKYRAAKLLDEGDLSLQEIANKLGTSKPTIYRFKRGLSAEEGEYLKAFVSQKGHPSETVEVEDAR